MVPGLAFHRACTDLIAILNTILIARQYFNRCCGSQRGCEVWSRVQWNSTSQQGDRGGLSWGPAAFQNVRMLRILTQTFFENEPIFYW